MDDLKDVFDEIFNESGYGNDDEEIKSIFESKFLADTLLSKEENPTMDIINALHKRNDLKSNKDIDGSSLVDALLKLPVLLLLRRKFKNNKEKFILTINAVDYVLSSLISWKFVRKLSKSDRGIIVSAISYVLSSNWDEFVELGMEKERDSIDMSLRQSTVYDIAIGKKKSDDKFDSETE